jgi:hypothetical protein
MNVEFEIKELEALVEPENLIDLLDDLLQVSLIAITMIGRMVGYFLKCQNTQ